MTVREYLAKGGTLDYKVYLKSNKGVGTYTKDLDINKYLDCEMEIFDYDDDDGYDTPRRCSITNIDDEKVTRKENNWYESFIKSA